MKALLSLATALFFVVGHPLNAEAKGRSFESGSFGKPKTFMTYKKSGPMGNVYVGRTSGFGSRQSILAKRDNNHHMDAKGYGPAKIDRHSNNPAAIRGREQQMIDKYKAEVRSGNAINGISPKNPKRNYYLSESEKEFGKPQEKDFKVRIVKLVNAKGVESFHQEVKTGAVLFDPRPNWLLLATPPGARPRKQELQWVHSADRGIAWDRQFRFADAPDQ